MKKKYQATAIIPAYNESRTITNVLQLLANSNYIDEVIVVDDASTDGTAETVKANFPSVKVIVHPINKGKADALLTGAKEAVNELLFFCDADLIGLNDSHLKELFTPIYKGEAQMICGSQEFMRKWDRFWFYRTYLKLKGEDPKAKELDDFFMGLGGERVLFKKEFLKIKNLTKSHYGVEYKINFHYMDNKLPYAFLVLRGVDHVWKFDKWNFKDAATKELPAIATFASQKIYKLLKYRN